MCTFATSNRLVFESVVEFLLKWTDKQYDMMASSVNPNADRVNARYKYACKLKNNLLVLVWCYCHARTHSGAIIRTSKPTREKKKGLFLCRCSQASRVLFCTCFFCLFSMALYLYSHYTRLVDIWSHFLHQLMSFGNGPIDTTLRRAIRAHCSFSDLKWNTKKSKTWIKYTNQIWFK